jgi:hypothetical protein
VTTTTVTKCTFSDSTWEDETKELVAERPHHTAIANEKLGADGSLTILEQQKGEKVHNDRLFTQDVPPVETKNVQKKLNPTTKKIETANVTKTVTTTVTGTTWVYRPKPKLFCFS